MKSLKFLFFVLAIAALAACNKNDDPVVEPPDTTVAVVINELLPRNTQHGSDQDGEFDDWIELYNYSSQEIDISGFYLSDNKDLIKKWSFPNGTKIGAMSYLIIWADDDTTQVGLHTNFKLSATNGESVLFHSADEELIDMVNYPPANEEKSWARKPNATGDFEWSVPTFNASND
jgi:hypothetical protein